MLKNYQTLNRKTEGTELWELEFIPKGTKTKLTIYVYGKNALEASNYLIFHKIWGNLLSTKPAHLYPNFFVDR